MNFAKEKALKKYRKIIRNTQTVKELEIIKIKILGRKGFINKLFSQINQLSSAKKREKGKKINKFKKEITKLIQSQQKKVKINASKTKIKKTKIYRQEKIGHLHPVTLTSREINKLFHSLGFSVYTGPEIETDEYCFRRLNVPPDHPARDLQDTIYIRKPKFLLRTQASSIESHLLANEKPPFKAAFPGRVYRNENVNKSNHFIFHHYQGVVVDHHINLKDLIGTLNALFKKLYGSETPVRYRCKYYPEVEPGLGLDLQCFNCHGQGCPLCKGAGWIEMGGAGIIHPKVMKMANIDPQQWRGFAFGLGLDRWTMAKYNINDIRTLLGGNLAYKPNQP